MRLGLIVEGHGEVAAAPELIRNHLARTAQYIEISKPVRISRNKIYDKFDDLEKATRLLVLQNVSAMLLLLDSDDDCPVTLAPGLSDRMKRVSGGRPSAVVLACREYESWFLSGLESLRGRRGIKSDAQPPPTIDSIRGAKEKIQSYMDAGRNYSETIDQPALSSLLDTELARGRSRSLDKFLREIDRMTAE